MLEVEFDECAENYGYTAKQKLEVRENTWYKIFMLQNYKVNKNMFIGTTLRWTSIIQYMNMVRRIYAGLFDEQKEIAPPSLLKYIHGLIDSGTEPIIKIEMENKEITIDDLIEQGVITNHEAQWIYSSVGPKSNEPDTSISCTRLRHSNNVCEERHVGNYTSIVQEYSTNPILGSARSTTNTIPIQTIEIVLPWVRDRISSH